MRLENLFGLPIDVISRHPITKMLVEYFKDMNGYRHGREHGRKEVKRDESSSPTRAGAVDHSLEETERKNRSALVHACIRGKTYLYSTLTKANIIQHIANRTGVVIKWMTHRCPITVKAIQYLVHWTLTRPAVI